MRIGELAEATGENVKTLRYWEDEDILDARRAASGYRYFGLHAVERVLFIREAQGLGFTLAEIRRILELREESGQPCAEVREQLRDHLELVRARLVQLSSLEAKLAARLRWAVTHPVPGCQDGCVYLSRSSSDY